MDITLKIAPKLDAKFLPAKKWYDAYKQLIDEKGGRILKIALEQNDGTVFNHVMHVLDADQIKFKSS